MNQAGEWQEQDLSDKRRKDRCKEGEKFLAETKTQPKKTRLVLSLQANHKTVAERGLG